MSVENDGRRRPSSASRDDTPRTEERDNEDGDHDEWLISCRAESAKTICTLLSCLRHVSSSSSSAALDASSFNAKDKSSFYLSQSASSNKRGRRIQPVTVFCSPTSLTFHTQGTTQQTQASVDIQTTLFSHYRVAQIQEGSSRNDPANPSETESTFQAGGEFCVNLVQLLECLFVLGTQTLETTKLCFSYNATKELLQLELLGMDGVLVTAALPGMQAPESDASLALAFRSYPMVCRMIVQSSALMELLHELELVAGPTCATFTLGPGGLEIAAVGYLGECIISIPSKGSHVVSFELANKSTQSSRTYPIHALLGSMKGLDIAKETCITLNSNGMMAIQHQVVETGPAARDGPADPNYMDFILCCLEEDDEEEEDGSTGNSQESTQESQSFRGRIQRTAPQSESRPQSRHPSRSQSLSLSDSDTENDEPDDRAMEVELQKSSVARLFGSVVAAKDASPEGNALAARRRRPPPAGKGEKSHSMDTSDNETEEEDEDFELRAFHASSPRRHPTTRTDDAECSSPELVYGRHH